MQSDFLHHWPSKCMCGCFLNVVNDWCYLASDLDQKNKLVGVQGNLWSFTLALCKSQLRGEETRKERSRGAYIEKDHAVNY